jgi:stage IV sporulation protein FB
MRIAIIAGCEIKVNWLFVAVLFVAALSGYLTVFLLSFTLVLLHEGCHALAARACGFHAREIELLPFGGVARIDGLFELNPAAEAIIAAAGPACNILLLMAALSLNAIFPLPASQLRFFLDVNMGIAALNLLPALPLDGGRILRGLLARHFDIVRVTRICAASGICASALLGALFLWAAIKGTLNLSVLLMAAFLCLSAWREYVQAPYLVYKGFAGKLGSLKRELMLPVRPLVARRDVHLGALVRRFTPGAFHMVTVVDDDCRRLGTLDEEQVVNALFKKGAEAEIGSVLYL